MSHDTFISRLAKHIQNRYDLQKQEVTIIFPNKRAAFYLRNAFKESCNQTIWLPQIISIEEAVTQWSGITLTDNIDLLFELIDIDAQLHKKQDIDISVFGSQAAQMLTRSTSTVSTPSLCSAMSWRTKSLGYGTLTR